MSNRKWTAEEDATLLALLPTHSLTAIGAEIGRTAIAVKQRREDLQRSSRVQNNTPLTAAQAKLVASHKAWADRGASKHAPKWKRWVTEDDLRSAAYLGLIMAARKFDPTRGLQFKTLAFTYCESHMRREIATRRRLDGAVFDRTVEGGMRAVAHRIEWPTLEDGTPWDLTVQTETYSADLEDRDRREFVMSLATHTPDRALLRLVLDGVSVSEMARRLGLTPGGVQQRINRLTERLRARAAVRLGTGAKRAA